MQLHDLMHKHCLLLSKTRKHSLWAKEMKELTLKEDKTEDNKDKTDKGTYMCAYIFLHITKKKKSWVILHTGAVHVTGFRQFCSHAPQIY